MSQYTPLWEIQTALYARLTTELVGVAVYDFMPLKPAAPYVFMERERVTGTRDKSGVTQTVLVSLVLVSTKEDSKELKEVCDSVVGALDEKLNLGDWRVIGHSLLPDMETFRTETVDGAQGRAVNINLNLLVQYG